MLEALDTLGRASGEWLWAPILAWTVLWLIAELGDRLGARAHPLVRYRAIQAALFALPVGLALSSVVDLAPWLNPPVVVDVDPMMLQPVAEGTGAQTVAPLAPEASLFTVWMALGLAVLAVAALAVVRSVQLGSQALTLVRLHRALPHRDPGLAPEARDLSRRLGLRRPVRAIASPEAPVPMTFGLWRPVVVIPSSLQGEERTLALLHELVHVQRRDALAGWAEALTAAVFVFHPGVGRLARRCHLLRELACDATLLSAPGVSRPAYATLVSAFAAPAPRLRAAVGMADSPSHVHQRITAMTLPLPLLKRSTLALGWALSAVLLVGASLAVTASRALAQEQKIIVRTIETTDLPTIVIDGERQAPGTDSIADLDVHSVDVLDGDEAQSRYGEDHVIEVITKEEARARGLPERDGVVSVFSFRSDDGPILRLNSASTDSIRAQMLDLRGGASTVLFEMREKLGPAFIELQEGLEPRLRELQGRLDLGETDVSALRLKLDSIIVNRFETVDGRVILKDGASFELGTRRPLLFEERATDGQPIRFGSVIRLNGTESMFAEGVESVEITESADGRVARLTMKDGSTREIRLPESMPGVIRADELRRAEQGKRSETTREPLAPVTILPNPASETVFVRFTMADAGTARLRLYDLAGRLVYERDVQRAEGRQSMRVAVSDLAPGTYVYRLETDDQPAQTGRFTVAR